MSHALLQSQSQHSRARMSNDFVSAFEGSNLNTDASGLTPRGWMQKPPKIKATGDYLSPSFARDRLATV